MRNKFIRLLVPFFIAKFLMHAKRILIWFVVLAIATSCSHFNSDRSPASVIPKTKAQVDALWFHVDKDKKDSMIKSNPNHYWGWMKLNAPNYFDDILSFEGQVTADAHYFNFGDIHHSDGRNGIGLVDIDDSGEAALILDIVRYILFTQAALNKDISEEIFSAYIEGLKQSKSPKVPPPIQASLKKSYRDLIEDNLKWVKQNLKADFELDNKKLSDPKKPEERLRGMKEVDEEIQIKAKNLAKVLERSGTFSKIYDEGYRTTRSGSSAGLDRFWFSTKSALTDELMIIECKQQATNPATAYYKPQKRHAQRVQAVLNVYSDFQITERFIIDANDSSYWCRPREWQYLKRSPVEDLIKARDKKEITNYSAFLAYWLGLKVSQQAPKRYVERLEKYKAQYVEAIRKILADYDREITRLERKQ